MSMHKYRTVVETLKAEILSGKHPVSKSFPSVRSLIRRFGVSDTTVLHALDDLTAQGYVSRRQGRGTFVTKDGSSRKIGMIISGLAEYSEFFQPIATALIRVAQTKGYELIFGDVLSREPEARIREARELAAKFIRQRVAGVVYHPLEYVADSGATNCNILNVFDRAKIPVVLLDSDIVPPPGRSKYDLVSIDNEYSGERLARHLMERGAKDIHFLMRPNWVPNVQSRARGVMRAKMDMGGSRQFNDILISEPDDLNTIRKYLKRHPAADAFICQNDTIAAVFKQTLESLGRNVPNDILLAGFDDVKVACLTSPSLTTIHQPCERIAEVVFSRLRGRIARPDDETLTIYVEAPLIVRDSTTKLSKLRKGKSKCGR